MFLKEASTHVFKIHIHHTFSFKLSHFPFTFNYFFFVWAKVPLIIITLLEFAVEAPVIVISKYTVFFESIANSVLFLVYRLLCIFSLHSCFSACGVTSYWKETTDLLKEQSKEIYKCMHTHTINVHTYVFKFTSHYSYSSSLFPSSKKTIFTHSKNKVITFPCCARPDRRDVYHLLPVNYLVYLILLFMLSEREECKGQKERVCAVHCFFHLKKSEEY